MTTWCLFFPLITAGGQYHVAEEWGYTYDVLIPADIPDNAIPNCIDVTSSGSCPICDANGTCIDCNGQTCPAPFTLPTTGGIRENNATEFLALPVGLGALGAGLGHPLRLSHKSNSSANSCTKSTNRVFYHDDEKVRIHPWEKFRI